MSPRAATGRTPRLASLVGLAALVTVALAARRQTATQPPAAPPAAPVAAAAPMAADSAGQDSALVADSMTVIDTTVVTMMVPTAPTPTPSAGTWPIDPATGQTIVNGLPVVGRAFIMRKPDGLVKYTTWQAQSNGEPAPPAAPIVGTSYRVPELQYTRRQRTIMVQATEWAIDGKRSARELRYHRAAKSDTVVPR
ncbi:MAG: hypothetical protein P3C10_00670 [Gemmatimonadota bacterium]|nr:hypothetical protein [Gemmatimonadota bacterium]